MQGEGLHVGVPTLFVRLGGCDLRCRWCDSPQTWKPQGRGRVELRRGSAEFRSLANPVDLDTLVSAAEDLELAAHAFVSLTGGEPLLQPAAAGELARRLRSRGPRILLETHGLATAALEQVVEWIDVVSMDWKLASDVRRADRGWEEAAPGFDAEHERFLAVARRASQVVVKVVVTPASRDAELDRMAEAVAAADPAIPVILQPVTPFGPVREGPGAERLLGWVARLGRRLSDLRVVPQTHKLYGAL